MASSVTVVSIAILDLRWFTQVWVYKVMVVASIVSVVEEDRLVEHVQQTLFVLWSFGSRRRVCHMN